MHAVRHLYEISRSDFQTATTKIQRYTAININLNILLLRSSSTINDYDILLYLNYFFSVNRN